MKSVISEIFSKDALEPIMKEPLILCNFMKSEPLDPEIEDPRIYE